MHKEIKFVSSKHTIRYLYLPNKNLPSFVWYCNVFHTTKLPTIDLQFWILLRLAKGCCITLYNSITNLYLSN